MSRMTDREKTGFLIAVGVGVVLFRLLPFVLVVWALCKYVGCA